MLIFNHKTMRKAFVNKTVSMADDVVGVAVAGYQDELVNEDPLDAFKNQECWVLFEKCDDVNGKEASFAYFPEYDVAVTILSEYLSPSMA